MTWGLIPSICQQAQSQGMADLSMGAKTSERWDNRPLFSMEAPEELPPLPAAVEVACYRIAQEAITNVARHAQARRCEVRLSVEDAPGALRLEVIDDGDTRGPCRWRGALLDARAGGRARRDLSCRTRATGRHARSCAPAAARPERAC